MASISEAFPYSVIESMLTGAAIVATTSAVREALGPSGVLVNPRDPAALAKAIVRLISSPASRRQLGEAARARALRNFTEDKFVAEYRGSYLRLTNGSHAVRPTDRPVIRPTFAAQTKAPYRTDEVTGT